MCWSSHFISNQRMSGVLGPESGTQTQLCDLSGTMPRAMPFV